MNVQGYLVSSTLIMVIAQRLVRRICRSCIQECKPTEIQVKMIVDEFDEDPKKMKFFKGKGCEECGGSGYRGRVGIFEILEMNDQLRSLAAGRASTDEIRKAAIKAGMTPMLQDGLEKVSLGMTTIEEIIRVTRE
jgi:type II secretory ATPase GspE/PulE/Tfp pilus assembly ATPase PilB-like protein